MKGFKIPTTGRVLTSGIVTVAAWTMADDGEKYLYFWCDRWEIFTDKMMPVPGFRSSEKWQLAAIVNRDILMLIPGCQVKAWTYSAKCPNVQSVYKMGGAK